MLSRSACSFIGIGLAALGVLAAAGCENTSSNSSTTAAAPSPAAEIQQQSSLPTTNTKTAETQPASEDHAHKPGSHGGIIIPIGSDSYHAEAVIEKGGEFRLLMLGKDESRIQEVEIQPIKAYVKVVGQPDSAPIELSAKQQEGDSSGQTSQFVGSLTEEMRGKALDVTIPNLRIKGERFRIGFTTLSAVHEEEMPASLPAAEEQALYLTAGGKYTEADIQANGKMTASQKFKGVMSSHDMKPKSGDRICPVTLTKANPKFTWVIDGKPYQFCCPPCVDEFVKTAKDQPDEIKPPDSYVK